MASTSRWFVGSSSRSRLTRRDWSSARCARVRSPGESVEQPRSGSVRTSSLAELTDPGLAAYRPPPHEEWKLIGEHGEQSRLPAPVPTRDRQPLPGNEVQFERSQPERSSSDDRCFEPEDELARAGAACEGKAEPPRLEGFLRELVARELPLRLADLRLQGVGRPAIGAPGALAERVSLPARLGASFREELRDVPAAIDRLLVLGVGGATLGLPSGGVVGPATGPLVHAVGRRLDLDDPAHDAIEQRAVMGDDHEPAPVCAEEAFESLEAVEVEVEIGRAHV